jgi:iron only hydrogenase large subunit-like protein
MTVTCQLTILSDANKISEELLKLEDIITSVVIVPTSSTRHALQIELKYELEQDELIQLGALIGRIDCNNV